MKNPMHIALISRYYPPDPGGGLAVYTRQIARQMVAEGHHVSVIAATPQESIWKPKSTEYQCDAGVSVVRIPQLKTYQRSVFGATCVYNSRKIAQTLMDLHTYHPVDVVQSPLSFFESLVYGRRLKQQLKIPLVVKFHENQETYTRLSGRFKTVKSLRRKGLGLYMRQASLDADFHLGVSKNALVSTRNYLNLEDSACPAKVSPSPIDLNVFYPRQADLPPDSHEVLHQQYPFLFYSGRLIQEKGLHLLLEAFLSVLAESHPDLRLVIAGEFDYRQPQYEANLRKMLAGHPAEARVIFLGRVSYEEMPWWYSQCRLFVGPSFCEPLGRVFLEAMACEAPVIAFNSGGPQEFIQHCQNGYLVNTQAVWALAQAILTMLENPDIASDFGRAGRKTVEQQYSLSAITQELLEIYGSLVKTPD